MCQVVFEDAVDLEEAVDICHNAIFGNHGQNCCAGELGLSCSEGLRCSRFFLWYSALDVTANCICEIRCLALDGFDLNSVHKVSSK